MKINDVLECVNKTLDKEREAKKLKVKGHFVHMLNVEKQIGTTKTFHALISFINNSGVNIPFIRISHTVACPIEQLEEMKDKVLISLLEDFFAALRFGKGKADYENFVNGTFEGWT